MGGLSSAGYDSHPATRDADTHLKGQARQSQGHCSLNDGLEWRQGNTRQSRLEDGWPLILDIAVRFTFMSYFEYHFFHSKLSIPEVK